MLRNELTLFIAREPGAVFALLTDHARRPEWMAGLVESTMLTPGPQQAGSRFRQVLAERGERQEDEIDVTEFEPGVVFATRMTSEGAEIQGRFTLEGMDGGTLLTYQQETEVPSALFNAIKPVFSFLIFQKHKADLARLQRLLETGP